MPINSLSSAPYLVRYCWLLSIIAMWVLIAPYSANTHAEANISNKTLRVGTYSCPPFVMIDDENSYQGLSFLLWNNIATNLNLNYSVQVLPLKELLDGVANGSLDIGLSCISITPEREEILDFSHSFYETNLAIAVKQKSHWQTFSHIIFNKKLLQILAIILITAATVGGIYYLLEHRVNRKLYSMKSPLARLVEGFILGLLFITKGPFNYYEFKTLTGRVLTVLLAVVTTLFIASITAVLASSFTLGLINSDIKSPNDLDNVLTGAKQSSTASNFLTNHSISHKTYPTVAAMLVALNNGEINALVDDDAILRYQIKKAKSQGDYQRLQVLPYQFEKQNYGIVLAENSPYDEIINRELLQFRKSNQWKKALTEYFKIK
ncbi:transporter substrate-binding domain-containing protein [Photobacterium aquimaris]|uniref:ABC transporter substrate-binding protein n=1 Tax=Photobacterium aquimaris TaxID=512643 RepID=A0A2T3HV58_9GAMM|nr:transporter substrate-binding domain-containing protein [Photobacterium aquimaris]MCP4956945.1 transporter substrate-binding domain-containing protein [Photobacterium aquimaris]OBU15503.1 ABC transporter substrate-binding protein [Photobacterium aquimaris]PQJ38610.1 ABC transporter substrate-binding protein [Photobacterium aquimaris]PSU02338.1 ABC transporter substrate-binding protein [Photobacterium aquimaris]